MSGRRVLIEVFWLRYHSDGGLSYRRAAGHLGRADTPDVTARRIAGLVPGRAGLPVMMHSTSWRHLDDGTIVLTYAVAPDPDPVLPAIAVVSPQIARSTDPTRPAPSQIRHEHVAAHAAQHLALLADTDPLIRDLLEQAPELSKALTTLPRAPASQLS